MQTIYRIHPGIGIARLGNSRTDFFVGPEAPEVLPLGSGPYRDASGRIKRQGPLGRHTARWRGGQNSADAGDLSAAALVRVKQQPPILTQQGEVVFFDREFFSGHERFSFQRESDPEHEPAPPDPPLGRVDGGIELRKARGTWRGGVLHARTSGGCTAS